MSLFLDEITFGTLNEKRIDPILPLRDIDDRTYTFGVMHMHLKRLSLYPISICFVLSACGGGDTEDRLTTLSFSKVRPTNPSVNEKLEDVIDLAYMLVDEENFEHVSASELPKSNVTVEGNILVDLSNYTQHRVAVGDTTLTIDFEKSENQISGTASNFVVADTNESGSIENQDAQVWVEQIVFTTTGSLTASGDMDADTLAQFGYDGDLQVLENGQYMDTVSVNSDGYGRFMSLGGSPMFLGVLWSDVTAQNEPYLNVENGETIVWAK